MIESGDEGRKAGAGREPRLDPTGRDMDRRNAKQRRWSAQGRSNPHRVKLDKDNNPGDAYWCEEHGMLECAYRKHRTSDRCHGRAIRGMKSCSKHVRMKMEKAIAMGEARISAWQALGKPPIGEGGAVDASTAVMGMLQMTWLRTALYGRLLQRQVEQAQKRAQRAGDQLADGDANSGLIGQKMSAAPGTGELYATGEEIRALVELEGKERDRVVKYAEIAHRMGITDRMTALAEQWSDVVAGRVMAVLGDLELTPEQETMVEGAITRHLSSVDISAIEG